MSDDREKTSRQWMEDAEEALNRTGEALRTAWNESKEARMATLEAAREAAAALGTAIDEGIRAARTTWESSRKQDPASDAAGDVETKSMSGEGHDEEE